MPDKPPEKENISEVIKKFWLPIAGFLGAITLAYNFYQLWLGDQKTVTWLLTGGGVTVLIIVLSWIGFSSQKIKRQAVWPIGAITIYYEPRFSLSFRRIAWGGLATIFVLLVIGGHLLFQNRKLLEMYQKEQEQKIIVAIANFDGPDPKNYRVTEQILSQLTDSLSGYDDTVIIPLGETIKEQEGSQKAKELGEDHFADLVIWGWYGITESDVLITVHVENLSEEIFLPLPASQLYGTQMPVKEIKSFHLQRKLSSQLTAITLFISGITRFEARDFQEAINRFSLALNEQWPTELTPVSYLYYYRGLSYQYSWLENFDDTNNEKAINDFSSALLIDSDFLLANYQRAFLYLQTGDFIKAKDDYRAVIKNASSGLFSYEELALISLLLDTKKAIEYSSLAIAEDPDNIILYSNRASAYQIEGDYEHALMDLNRAIELDSKLWLNYLNRAEIYITTYEYELAIQDLDKSLDLFSLENATEFRNYIYFRRGYAYSKINNYDMALDDYTSSLEINPSQINVYEARGDLYLQMGSYENSIKDLSFALQNDYSFATPNNYYLRGNAFEKLDYPGNAFVDYAFAAEEYNAFATSFYDQGYIDQATGMCDSAIRDFEKLSDGSENQGISEWSRKVADSFTNNCPSSSIEKIPTRNWGVELAINPIIPGVGLAGIKLGESLDIVLEHLGDGSGFFQLTGSNVEDCCIGGIWVSDDIALIVYFSLTDQTIVDFYLEMETTITDIQYIPFINKISLGSTEDELFLNWGNPISKKILETPKGCVGHYYEGVMLRICGKDGIIDLIEIPGIIN